MKKKKASYISVKTTDNKQMPVPMNRAARRANAKTMDLRNSDGERAKLTAQLYPQHGKWEKK